MDRMAPTARGIPCTWHSTFRGVWDPTRRNRPLQLTANRGLSVMVGTVASALCLIPGLNVCDLDVCWAEPVCELLRIGFAVSDFQT